VRVYSDKEILRILLSDRVSERSEVVRYLYRKCYPPVLDFILKNSGEQSDCEDLFQDALEVFYNQILRNKFQEKSSVTTYFIGIARNLWYARIRKRKRELSLQTLNMPVADEEPIQTNQNLQLFYRLFDQLDRDCKAILRYAYYENLSISEILNKFDTLKNEQSVRTKKYRCLKYLTNIFNKNKVSQENFIL